MTITILFWRLWRFLAAKAIRFMAASKTQRSLTQHSSLKTFRSEEVLNPGALDHERLLCDGSPGLMVMGGDSRSRGRGFESQHQILCF